MSEVSSFFHMGGYAAFVWPSFALTFIVLLINIVWSRAQYKRAIETASRRAQSKSSNKSQAN